MSIHPAASAASAASAENVAIAIRGASLTIEDKIILDDVTFDVQRGELLVLVGPNGAGKSTLLAVMAGDKKLDSGSVSLAGIDPAVTRPRVAARKRAVLLQEQRVSFPFAVRDVVRMGRMPWRGTPAEAHDDEVVAAAMAQADIAGLAPRTFGTLSGGEKARTGYARTLAHGTGIQLLDEPTAALDIHHQEELLGQARAATRHGMTVVVVLHDLALAAAYADRIAVMCAGQLRALGHPRAVLTSSLLTDVYRHPVAVVDHPATGELLIAPVRATMGATP